MDDLRLLQLSLFVLAETSDNNLFEIGNDGTTNVLFQTIDSLTTILRNQIEGGSRTAADRSYLVIG